MLRYLFAILSLVNTAIYAGTYSVSTSSYLGASGNDDAVKGCRILSDGTIVLAANIGSATPGGLAPLLLNGATVTSSGAILRLSADGQTLLSITRLAAQVQDLAIDANDALYIAAGSAGLLKLPSTADSIVWQQLAGTYVHRIDAAAGGRCVAFAPTNTSDPDEAGGAGRLYHYDATGTLVADWAGRSNTFDVCVDEASQTIIYIGFRQTNAFGPPGDNQGYLPVQIAYLRGVDYFGVEKWLNYDWANITGYSAATNSYVVGANDPPPAGTTQAQMEPRFLNRVKNNMADTRGLRCALGADGKLYAAFECAGGNHIFRDAPTSLATAGSIVNSDLYHQFVNTGAEHKTYIGRYEPGTGSVLLGQQYNTVVANGNNVPGANTLRIKSGDLTADATGRLYFGAECAYGLPMFPGEFYSPQVGQETFNPFNASDYLGGAYFYVMSADFTQRLYVTRLATGGTTHAVAARTLVGQTEPRIAFAGSATLGAGPIYTQSAIQPNPGYGQRDGFFAVLGGSSGGAGNAEATFRYGGSGVSYTGSSQLLRDVIPTNSLPVDLDGDGRDDSEKGYAFSPTTPLSPAAGYTGPTFYGGLRTRSLNTWSQAFNDNRVLGTELGYRVVPSTGVSSAHHGIVFFDRSVFTGLLPTDTLSFNRRSALYSNAAIGRWVVRQGGLFYVSEKRLSDSALLSFDSDTDDGLWARYDPAADLDFKAEGGLFERQNFTNIDAIGFVIDQDNYSTSQIWLRMTQFTATLSVNQVPNTSPEASFVATPALGSHPLPATLDGTASSDPGGAVSFYAWSLGEGSKNSGPAVSATYPAAGAYVPMLTVYDNQLQRTQTQRRLEVVSDLGGSPTNTVVAFGGNIGSVPFRRNITETSGIDVDADGANDDFIQEILFDPAVALSGAATKGTLWQGGLRSTDRNAKSNWADKGTVNNTASSLAVRIQPGATAPITLHGLLYLDKSQFLNRASIMPVSFEASSTVKLAGVSRWEQLGQVRWLVREGQQFYVSSATITPVNQAATLSFSSSSIDGDWATWTPGSSMNFDASNAVFSQRNFSNITAIGLVIDRDSAVAGTTRHWMQFSKFEVVAAITNNQALPVAQIQTSPLNRDVFQRITFDATGSTSSGVISSYEWDFGDGTRSTGPDVQHEYLSLGSKTITLRVTNDLGQTDTETFTYQVTANPAPVASFTATPTAGEAPLAVQLDASASTDDATIVSYEWDFQGDGVYDATGVTTTANYPSAGLYAANLRVTDAGGKTSVATTSIRCTSAGKVPPVALMTLSTAGGSAPLTITFSALPSWDPDGSIATYNWDFTGDNMTDTTGLTASWNYVTAGSFTPKLTVIDNEGASTSSTQTVSVSLSPGAVPFVYWSGNSVTTTRPFRGVNPTSTALDLDLDGSADDMRVEYAFFTNQVLSPTSNYTGSPFYGGVRNELLNATSFAPFDSGVLDAGILDRLTQRLQPSATSSARWHWTLFFDKTHFINGGASQPVRFMSNSRLRLANINNNERTGQLRWLVREGGQFYASQAVMTVASNSAALMFSSDHQDGVWAEYQPTTQLNFDASTANFQQRNFTNITAAGFILDKDNYESARHWFSAGTYEFLGALPPSYSEWITSYNVSNPAATADPDDDGWSNLLEYALGGVPNTAENSAPTELQATAGGYVFRYLRSKLAQNISYTIQTSTDLMNWQAYTGTELTPVDLGSHIQHQAPIAASPAGRVFVRLRVE